MKRFCLALVISILPLPIFCSGQEAQKFRNYALVIGISGYPHFQEEDRLHYASQDALLFSKTIESETGVPFPRENVKVLQDEAATLEGIQRGIAWLAARPDAGAVYVFFSGHGLFDKSGQAYFIPWDGYKNDPMILGIPADVFLREVRNIRANTLVLLIDACHAAAALNYEGVKGSDDVSSAVLRSSQPVNDDTSSGEQETMTWVSSSSNEISLEDRGLKAGIFTHFLTQGIKGAAAKKGSTGPITAPDLYDYISRGVETQSGGKQHITRSAQMSSTFEFAKTAQIQGEVEVRNSIVHDSLKRASQPQTYRTAHLGAARLEVSKGQMEIYANHIYYSSNKKGDNLVFALSDIQEAQQDKGITELTGGYSFHIQMNNGLTYHFHYLNDALSNEIPDPLIDAIKLAILRIQPSANVFPVLVTEGKYTGCLGNLHIESGKMWLQCKSHSEGSFSKTSLGNISVLERKRRSDLRIGLPNGGRNSIYGFTFQGDPNKRPPAGAIEQEILRAHRQDGSRIDVPPLSVGPDDVLLPINTAIPLRFLGSVCSSTAVKGSAVPLEVTSDVSADGYVVIPKGTVLDGELSDARHERSFGRRGFLRVRLDMLVASDGHPIPVMGGTAVKGDRWNMVENSIMQGLNHIPEAGPYIALAYWIAAPGQEVGIHRGQTMRAFTLEDVAVGTARLTPESGMNEVELEDRLTNGEELRYRVFNLRPRKKGDNLGVLKVSGHGVGFFSNGDETARFTAGEIKRVAMVPSVGPCGMPNLSLVGKTEKGKKSYTFIVEEDGQPAPPDEALEALQWLQSTALGK